MHLVCAESSLDKVEDIVEGLKISSQKISGVKINEYVKAAA